MNGQSVCFFSKWLHARRVPTCMTGTPGLTNFSETLALFFIQFLSVREMKVQDRQNVNPGLPEKTGWLRACTHFYKKLQMSTLYGVQTIALLRVFFKGNKIAIHVSHQVTRYNVVIVIIVNVNLSIVESHYACFTNYWQPPTGYRNSPAEPSKVLKLARIVAWLVKSQSHMPESKFSQISIFAML